MEMKVEQNYKHEQIDQMPVGWEIASVGEHFDFKNGLNKAKEFFGHGTPIANYMDVFQKVGLREKDIKGLVSVTKDEIRNYGIKKGDVLFTRTSETVEEIGLSSTVLEDVKDGVFSGFVLRARPKTSKFTPEFSQYCFRTPFVRKQITSKSSYTTRALTNGRLLSSVKVAIPEAKEEQTAIATVLSDTDAFIAGLEKLVSKKRNIKKGAMQELLRPKEGWELWSLGKAFQFFGTANNSRSELLTEGEQGNVSYIHYGDIHTLWCNFIDFSKDDTPTIAKAKVSKVPLLEDGDLIVADASEDYEGLGACVEVRNLRGKQAVAGLHTLLLRGDKSIVADGFKGYISELRQYRQELIRMATGISVYGISKNNLKKMELLLPPIQEQKRIAAVLFDIDADIDALERRLAKYKEIRQGMMQVLLTGKVRLV